MKDHGLKILAAGLLLTLVVLPGHGQQKAPAPQTRVRIQKDLPKVVTQEDCDCICVDLADVDLKVSRAMEEASIAIDDAKLDAVLAELAQNEVVPAPEAEPDESGNVFYFSTDDGHGWLGVNIAEVNAEKVKELKLPAERGVVVTGVEKDSPAAKAGLKSGDVITELNGLRIEGTVQLRRLVRETPPGRTMALTVWRDGRAQTISAVLAEGRVSRHHGEHDSYSWPGGEFTVPIPAMPAMPAMPRMGEFFAPRTPRLGVDVEDLSGELGKYFGAPDGEGVLIRGVSSGSPAEKAGIKAGDVIIKVAGERVRTSSDLRSGLREKRESKKIDVVVIRKGTEMTLPVEIEPMTPPEGRRVARRVAA